MDNLTPRRPSIVDAADDLRKEWQMNGRPEDAPAVPEGVDTAELPKPDHRGPDGTGAYFDAYTPQALVAFGAQQREAGRRDMHETNVALVNANCTLAEQLVAVRSAFHVNMLRAFPDKSHAELDAEITRATGVAGPVTALTDEQAWDIGIDLFGTLIVAPHDTEYLKIIGKEDEGEFARALLAASPKVEPVELIGIAEQIDGNAGFWHSCSGCHETEDGHPVGNYAYSTAMRCALGSGCSECGGLGAMWDNNDYSEEAYNASEVQPVSDDKRDAELSKLRSEMAYIAAYSLEELQTLSQDRLLMRADAIIQRAQRAVAAIPPQPKPETKK